MFCDQITRPIDFHLIPSRNKQTPIHLFLPQCLNILINEKKKNVDSRLSIDNSVKNWSETERIESRLSPPEQKYLDPGQEGWNDIYIYPVYDTPHAAGNSRRGGIQEITPFVAAQRELPSQEFERIW